MALFKNDRNDRAKTNNLASENLYGAELEALEVAYNHFNTISDRDVEPELVEAAMYELKAAELKLDVAVRRAKSLTHQAAVESCAESKRKENELWKLLTGYSSVLESLSSTFKSFITAFRSAWE